MTRAYASASPPTVAVGDTAACSLGMEFYVSEPAFLTHIHFWQPTTGSPSTATRKVALYSTATGMAGTQVVAPENLSVSGSGWQSHALSSPYSLTPGTRYRAVVYHPGGQYAATANYFTSGDGVGDGNGVTFDGYLTVPSNADSTGNGQMTFIYDQPDLAFPVNSFNGGNYWIDVTVSQGLSVSVGGDTSTSVDTPTGTLTATPSGGTTPYVYEWTVQSGPVGAFSADDEAATTFTPNNAGTSVLRCTVTDGDSATAYDELSVTVSAGNVPPTVNVGPDKSMVDGGNTALLSAVTDSDGTVTGVAWTVQSGPSTSAAQFSTTTDVASTFAPAGGAGNYVIRCTATDNGGATGFDELTLTVTAPPTGTATRFLATAEGWVPLTTVIL